MIKFNCLSNIFYILFISYLLAGCDYKEKHMEINQTFESNETKKYIQNEISGQNKIYLDEMNIDELFKEFLYGNITIQNPFVSENNLNAFGWEKLYNEWTYDKDNNYKCARKFALVDLDGDEKDELIFSAGENDYFEEIILLLHSNGKQLSCWDIYETHTQRMGASIYSNGIVRWENTIQDDYCEDVYYQYKHGKADELIHFFINYDDGAINSNFGSYYLNGNKKEIYLIRNNNEYEEILKEYVGEMKSITWFNCDNIADIN